MTILTTMAIPMKGCFYWLIWAAGNGGFQLKAAVLKAFTDAEIKSIGEAVTGYLANGDYKGAFDEFLWHVEYELENYENAGGGDVIERPAEGTATVFVIDEAELLTEEEEQLLEEKIALRAMVILRI